MADEPNEQKPNPAETFQNLLGKYNNDGVKLASQLFDENFQYRNTIRDLKMQLPKDGSVTLSADEAKEFNQFKKLKTEANLEFKDIRERVEKFQTLESENQKLTKRDKLRSIERLGYDLEVLEDRMSLFPTAEFSTKKIKDEKDSTKEVEVPYVTLDGKESSLDDFAKEHFPKFLPVLKANQEAQVIKPGNGAHDPRPSGTQGGWWAQYEKRLEDKREAKKAPAPSLDAAFGRTGQI